MMKKISQIFGSFESKDERIRIEISRIATRLYPLMMLLLLGVILLKCVVFDYSIQDCLLELIVLVSSLVYIIVRSLAYPIPIKKSTDEHIRFIQERFVSHAYFEATYLLIFGELLLMYLLPAERVMMIAWYISIWIVPTTIFTIQIIRKGLFIAGSKKKKKIGLKELKKRIIIGSLFFGALIGFSMAFTKNGFEPIGILMMLLMAVLWGILFYFLMKLMMNKSEKKADQ